MKIIVSSQAFGDGGMIPRQHTCDGEDVSPPLVWTGIPEGTRTVALLCEDPDCPTEPWVHWILFNLPASFNELPEAVPPVQELTSGAKQGKNDFRRIGYGGPCPPSGTHRYYFRLYALDTELNLAAGVTKTDLLKAIKGHVLAEGQLMGRYGR